MKINRLNLRNVVAIAICLAAMTVFSDCKKDEVIVKFDEKTFIEQKKLWQLSNTKDYEYHLLANGFVSYYGKIFVENGSFKNDEILHEYSHLMLNYSTIDLVYKTIEEIFHSSNNGTKKSGFYYTEIVVEYDKVNHIPIKINYKYYSSPNLSIDGTFDYTITNFNKQN
ncbi:MAG: DUF6174 domain-containing protein [Tannerella sp.]|jgi:hypothetical protein|nr:DUF6174 domain-containing protein [Tannerella sp.]